MPTEDIQIVRFRSGEARGYLVSGIALLALVTFSLASEPLMASGVPLIEICLLLLAGRLLWRGIRGLRESYIQLDERRLVVIDCGRPVHYIDLASIAETQHERSRTILKMRDGMRIPISHLGFVWSSDAEQFKTALHSRVNGQQSR